MKLTDPEKGRYAWMCDLSMVPTNGVYYYFVNLLTTAGGKFLDKTNWKALFNSDEGVEALEFIKDLDQKYKVLYPGTLQNTEREKSELTSKIEEFFEETDVQTPGVKVNDFTKAIMEAKKI